MTRGRGVKVSDPWRAKRDMANGGVQRRSRWVAVARPILGLLVTGYLLVSCGQQPLPGAALWDQAIWDEARWEQ